MSTPPQVPQIKWDDAPEIKWDDTPAVGATPTGTIAPTHATYLQKLEGDVRHGTATTIPGKVLQMMGARGTDTGVSPGAAEQGPASLPLGVIKAMQGVQEGSPLKALGGAMQAATIPLAFTGNAPGAAESVMGKTIPSVMKEQASAKLGQVASAAGKVPLDVNEPGMQALRVQELLNRGAPPGGVSKMINQFIRRITAPGGEPMTYSEARDFYTNATAKTAREELSKMSGPMRMEFAKFTKSLGQSITDAAGQVGQADNYTSAMQQFARGAQASKAINNAAKAAVPLTGIAAVDYMLRKLTSGH